MSVIRVCVINPNPENPRDDVVVYQVPENSQALRLLTNLLDKQGIEWVTIESKQRRPNHG